MKPGLSENDIQDILLGREAQQYAPSLKVFVYVQWELLKNWKELRHNTIRYYGVQKSDDVKQKTNNHQTKEALMHLNDKIAIASQLTPLTYQNTSS